MYRRVKKTTWIFQTLNLTKEGTVRVELKFGAALPNTVTVVAYAEFENVIEID